MAQLRNVGQGGEQQQSAVMGSMFVSVVLLMSLISALIGIKIWGFRRRLNFNRGEPTTRSHNTLQQPQQTPPRYAAYESQVNGTDSAVHGVFRQRNTEEIESTWPSTSTLAANRHITGSVPNLRLHSVAPLERHEELPSISNSEHIEVTYRQQPPQAQRRQRREVISAHLQLYASPPTRQPPTPPTPKITNPATVPSQSQVEVPPTELGIPHFDHFAEKYELISAKPEIQLRNKQAGGYVKFEQVDDMPELLTPDDDQVGAAIAVTATVHQQEEEPEPEPEAPGTSGQVISEQDSAFVVEIIAGTPEANINDLERTKLFEDLELPHGEEEFLRYRSTSELNEADILDFDQLQLPLASSPPGFGKSIDEDWENFENLAEVAAQVNPQEVEQLPSVEETLSEATLELDQIQQVDTLFEELESIEEPATKPEPPPYEAGMPPFLPDYESLMQLENSQIKHNLPNYAEVVSKSKYVNSIEDLYAELEADQEETLNNHLPAADFEDLCEELDIETSATPPPLPRSAPPQPAPRTTKSATLKVRGEDAPPLSCYQRDELPSSSASETEMEVTLPPQPAKRKARTLKVRFDVENLQYYQSAEVVLSSSEDELPPPRPMLRVLNLEQEVPPSLFGNQVSQFDSDDDDDDAFGQAISQHRSMTQALRPFNEEANRVASNDTEA